MTLSEPDEYSDPVDLLVDSAPGVTDYQQRDHPARGTRKGMTREQRADHDRRIAEACHDGMTQSRAAIEFGVSTSTVNAAVRRYDSAEAAASSLPEKPRQTRSPRRDPVTVADVFDGREALRRLRDNARNAGEAPFAVLAAAIIRVLVATPPTLTLPGVGARSGTGSLNMYAALAAPSGGGKGESADVARNSLDVIDTHGTAVTVRELPIGSGEGLIAAFMPPPGATEPEESRLLFDVDEITQLTALSGRTGATLEPTILSMFSGKTVGNTNASKETTRRVEAGTYRVGILTAMQPSNAGDLLNKHGSGLPQRFLWADMDDPEHDMDTPEAPPVQVKVPAKDDPPRSVVVCDEVRAAIRADKEGKRDGHYPHAWDSHAIQCQEIVGVALSLLDGRNGDVTSEDWRLAGLIWQHNRDTRVKCLQGSRDKATEEATERLLVRTAARDRVSDSRVEKAREVIEEALRAGQGRFARSKVRNDKARRCRTEFDDVLAEMKEDRKVSIATDKTAGAEWVVDIREDTEGA